MLILQACGTGAGAPEPDPVEEEPIALDSTMPEGEPGVAGQEYSFVFSYNENLAQNNSAGTMAAGSNVLFRWTFGDGTQAGSATVTVDADGKAVYEVKHTYHNDGRYGIALTVEDEHNNVLATNDFIVEIGEVEEEALTLTTCDGEWHPGGAGGYGVSIDRWDISTAPAGATFDLRYDAYTIPDKFFVEYPEGVQLINTGWRGSALYEGDSLYPGGIAGEGSGEELDVFTKATADEFIVTTFGPGAGTAWDYDIRCTP